MTDTLTPEERSARMARVKGRDTKPEIRVRRALHAAGLRFRLHANQLPGRPDIVLPSRRVAVLVHGCFWHQHPDPKCKLSRMPKSRLEFWKQKLQGNTVRDARKIADLIASGWHPIVIWECETISPENLDAMVKVISAICPITRRKARGSGFNIRRQPQSP